MTSVKFQMLLLLLISSLRASISNNSTKNRCPPPPTAGLFTCRGRELKEVPLPIGAPTRNRQAIDSLDISNNLIEILHEDTLRAYPMLKQLRIERNRLWKLTDKAFRAVPHLEHLYLRGNQLVIRPGGLSPISFVPLTKLKTLDLSENPIGVIPGNFFKPMTSLTHVKLEKTARGLILEKDAFAGLKQLQELSLVSNAFENLPDHIEVDLMAMPNLTNLQLHENNWNCDCNLAWFARLLRRLILLNTNLNKPLCKFPKDLYNKVLLNLALDEFQCVPVILNKEPSPINEAEVGATINIICNFYANPREYVRWYKDDRVIIDQPRIRLSTDAKTNGDAIFQSNLTLSNAQAGIDDGVYACEAGNKRGRATASFPIRIDYHPFGGFVNNGEPARVAALIANNSVIFSLILSGTVLAILTAIGLASYCYCRAKAEEAERRTNSQNRKNGLPPIGNASHPYRWQSKKDDYQGLDPQMSAGSSMLSPNCQSKIQQPITVAATLNCSTHVSWSKAGLEHSFFGEIPEESVLQTDGTYFVQPLYQYQVAYYPPTQEIPTISFKTVNDFQ